MKEVVDAIAAYGLPGWAVLVIGGGSIVAAVIGSIQAVVVASINARANRHLARDNSRREYRMSATRSFRDLVRARHRKIGLCFYEVPAAPTDSTAEAHLGQLDDGKIELNHSAFELPFDAALAAAVSHFQRTDEGVCNDLRRWSQTGSSSDSGERLSLEDETSDFAISFTRYAEAVGFVETATEAFVFDDRFASRLLKIEIESHEPNGGFWTQLAARVLRPRVRSDDK